MYAWRGRRCGFVGRDAIAPPSVTQLANGHDEHTTKVSDSAAGGHSCRPPRSHGDVVHQGSLLDLDRRGRGDWGEPRKSGRHGADPLSKVSHAAWARGGRARISVTLLSQLRARPHKTDINHVSQIFG